jgi:hypothetical protein
LLKPARFRPDPEWAVPPSDRDGIVHDEDLDSEPEWITYEFRKAHPVLQWLPTKLGECIGVNLFDALTRRRTSGQQLS